MKHFSLGLIANAKYSPSLDGKIKPALKEKSIIAQLRLATMVISIITALLLVYFFQISSNSSTNSPKSPQQNLLQYSDQENLAKQNLAQINKNLKTKNLYSYFDIKEFQISDTDNYEICLECKDSEDLFVAEHSSEAVNEISPFNWINHDGHTYPYYKVDNYYRGQESVSTLKIGKDLFIASGSANIIFREPGKLKLDEKTSVTTEEPITKSGEKTYAVTRDITISSNSSSETNNIQLEVNAASSNMRLLRSNFKPDEYTNNGTKTQIDWKKLKAGQAIKLRIRYTQTSSEIKSCSFISVISTEHSKQSLKQCDPVKTLTHDVEDSADLLETTITSKVGASAIGEQIENRKHIEYKMTIKNKSQKIVSTADLENVDISELLEHGYIESLQNGVVTDDGIKLNKSNLEPGENFELFFRLVSEDNFNNVPDCTLNLSYLEVNETVNVPNCHNQVASSVSNNSTVLTLAIMTGVVFAASLGFYYYDLLHIHKLKEFTKDY